jgi:hypothetical protein
MMGLVIKEKYLFSHLDLSCISLIIGHLCFLPFIFLYLLSIMSKDILYSAILLALLQVIGTTSPFAISYNSRYLRADKFSPDTSQTFANASATALTPLSYSVNYLESFPNV